MKDTIKVDGVTCRPKVHLRRRQMNVYDPALEPDWAKRAYEWRQRCESEKARADQLADELRQTKTRLADVQLQHARMEPKLVKVEVPVPHTVVHVSSVGLREELWRKYEALRGMFAWR